MFSENRGMFYLVERVDGLLGEIAEKTAGNADGNSDRFQR
jgi:hypothetical protein